MLPLAGFGQNRIALKAGPALSFQNSTRIQGQDLQLASQKEIVATWIVPAIVFTDKQGANHQLSVEAGTVSYSDYSLSDTVPSLTAGERNAGMKAGLRYQVMIFLAPEKNVFRPFLGGSAEGILTVGSSDPYTSAEFITRVFTTNLYAGGLIGGRFKVRERAFLDVDFGYAPISVQYLNERTNNPTLPVRLQTISTVGLDFLTNLRSSVAFGIWL